MLKVDNKSTKVICSIHIETSQLIFIANQLAGFYMGGTRFTGNYTVEVERIQHIYRLSLLLIINLQFTIRYFHSLEQC